MHCKVILLTLLKENYREELVFILQVKQALLAAKIKCWAGVKKLR